MFTKKYKPVCQSVLEDALTWVPEIILNLSHCLECLWEHALTELKGRSH